MIGFGMLARMLATRGGGFGRGGAITPLDAVMASIGKGRPRRVRDGGRPDREWRSSDGHRRPMVDPMFPGMMRPRGKAAAGPMQERMQVTRRRAGTGIVPALDLQERRPDHASSRRRRSTARTAAEQLLLRRLRRRRAPQLPLFLRRR